MKEKLRSPWSPFPHEYSSCSNLKPETFEWSQNEGQYTVHIDNTIMRYRGSKNGSFGWFCESREVLPDLHRHLSNNHNSLMNYFEKIFTCDRDLISKNPSLFEFSPPGSNLPWTKKENYRIPQKDRMCSMIASPKDMTTGHKLRIEVASKYRTRIDLFGGALGSQRIGEGLGPNGDWWRSKDPALSRYRFSIVFENASYPDYHTEKITDCFAQGVIPVYWGDPNIGNVFNLEGIIKWTPDFDLNSLTVDLYDSMSNAMIDNLERVSRLESADDLIYKKIRELKGGI